MSEIYRDASQPVEKRVDSLLSLMTTEEKIAQLNSLWVYEVLEGMSFAEEKAEQRMSTGIGQITRIGGASSLEPEEGAKLANQIQRYLVEKTRLGIPALVHEESCSGYMAKGATCFPQTIGVASTWNPGLVERMGTVIRTQMKTVGAHQALAPLLDVTRDARWGRVEETFGEDPYLVSQMGLAYVRALQGTELGHGVIATGKHFVGYGTSEGGMNWAPPHIPSRELHDVFLLPFEAVVKEAKLGSIMPGYHELDGVPCHGSKELLRDILRNQWGFDGIVVSDYFAVNMLTEYHCLAESKHAAAKMALEAGVDIELPSIDCYGAPISEMVETGDLDIKVIDAAARRILTAKFRMGLFEQPYVDETKVLEVFDTPEQRALARTIAQESMVLLKNEGSLLPLSKDIRTLAVIGPNADSVRNVIGDYAYPCHIETLQDMTNVFNTPIPESLELDANFVPIISVLEGIKEKVSPSTNIVYAHGVDVNSTDTSGIQHAVETAEKADVAIVVLGDKAGLIDSCTTGESRDRADLNLPGKQEELLRAIHDTGIPVVGVLINGRPMSISWMDDNVPAILEAWLPGEEGAQAVADVLFGDYNPAGRLPMSVPRSVGQVPIYYNHKPSGGRSHWKGDYVEMSTKPLYPFGYGLSYSTFEYSNLTIHKPVVGVRDHLKIQVDVENTGGVAGDEVVQLYIQDESASVTRPVKELKGFVRLNLAVGTKRTVTFTVPISALGFHSQNVEYVVEPGVMKVLIGTSSVDIRETGSFEIVGDIEIVKDREFSTKVSV